MTAPGFMEIKGVFDPESNGRKRLRIETSRLEWLRTRGPPWIARSARLAIRVLRDPVLIYDGDRNGVEEVVGRVYVGFPRFRYDDENRRRPARESEAFCVFHNADGIVFEWRWIDFESGLPPIEELKTAEAVD